MLSKVFNFFYLSFKGLLGYYSQNNVENSYNHHKGM